jgi:hypothetical protein
MQFDFEKIVRAEFYVCLSVEGKELHYQVPVDTSVQEALKEMVSATVTRIAECKADDRFEEFSPSQKYGSTDAVFCKLDSEFAEVPRALLAEMQVPETRHALDDLQQISYYYVIAFDEAGTKLLGVRRASQFKGVLKSKLVTIVDNTMKLLPETTFRLDSDFDYLVFDDVLWALRPAGLEFTGKLTEAVKAAAPQSAEEVVKRVPFLDLMALGSYASKHPRAARYLAAVRARADLEDISQELLIQYCANSNIKLVEKDGKHSPAEGYEILFLEVLDRRVFTAELIKGQKERYEAPNRRNV